MQKARLLLLDVIDRTGFKEIECEDLQDYYNALKCDCFDIAYRRIGPEDRYYDIFVDDCGLFADDPIVSALDDHFKPALVGNLIFAKHDVQGNTVGLTDEDIAYIKRSSMAIVNFDEETEKINPWTVVANVRY